MSIEILRDTDIDALLQPSTVALYRPLPRRTVPDPCRFCSNYVASKRECKVLLRLLDPCFVLRQKRINEERERAKG